MKEEHAKLVGRIIYGNILECSLSKFKRMISNAELLPEMNKIPMTVNQLSKTNPIILERNFSSNIIAVIVNSSRLLNFRFTFDGFNKIYQINEELLEKSPNSYEESMLESFRHKLRRINSRNRLTFNILQEIISQQKNYLITNNPIHLVPITQSNLAERISSRGIKCDTSWISRLINGILVRTPSGEEKPLHFFLPSTKKVNKFFLQNVLDTEKKKIISENMEEPYSDSQLKDIFQSKNNSLSTRTIAQYRREMGILSAKRRVSVYKYPPISAHFSLLYPLTIPSVRNNAPTSPGIYELRLKHRETDYPNSKTSIIYIGSSKNIKKRLGEHLSKNSKNEMIKDFLAKYECSFRYIQFANGWKKEELRFYRLFSSTYGTQPKCNKNRPGGISECQKFIKRR